MSLLVSLNEGSKFRSMVNCRILSATETAVMMRNFMTFLYISTYFVYGIPSINDDVVAFVFGAAVVVSVENK